MSKTNNTTDLTKKKYHHLTLSERGKIEAYLEEKLPLREIARRLGRSASTISTEIKRGTTQQMKTGGKIYDKYLADYAHLVYLRNRKNCVSKGLEVYSPNFFIGLEKALKERPRVQSVESFVHLYKEKYPEEKVPSFKTVYRLIDEGLLEIRNIDLPKKVSRRPKKEKSSRPKGTNKKKLGKSIDERPESVLERKEFGHYEADLVKGKKVTGEPALLTLVERKTRFAVVRKIDNFEAKTVNEALKQALSEVGTENFKSITFDNGAEFSEASKIEELGIQVYFAHAYSSWERGSNENFNGLLREFVRKGQSIKKYSEADIKLFETCLNMRPRKILGFLTAAEAFEGAA